MTDRFFVQVAKSGAVVESWNADGGAPSVVNVTAEKIWPGSKAA